MVPEVSKFGLSSNVPDCELQAFVVDFFDVETDGGYGCDGFVEFHLVEDGGFACSIEAEEEDLGFHVSEGVE